MAETSMCDGVGVGGGADNGYIKIFIVRNLTY